MSVLAEGLSVIVRRSTIETRFPGGLSSYERIVPSESYCADQHLTRVGFPTLIDAEVFILRLKSYGLEFRDKEGCEHISLFSEEQGIGVCASWLESGRDESGHPFIWLAGTDPGRGVAPEGWSPKAPTIPGGSAGASDLLRLVENTETHSVFLHEPSGSMVYKFETADPSSAMDKLARLTEELRVVRDRLQPIYDYHFPKNWLKVIGRTFGVVQRDDFGRHAISLGRLREAAIRIAQEGKSAFDSIAGSDIEDDLKEGARLAYLQTYYDATLIVRFDDYIRAMREGDRKASAYFQSITDLSRKARANLGELQKATAWLNMKRQ